MCLIVKDVPQKYVLEWFNEHVTHPTIKHIRCKFNPLSIDDPDDGSAPVDQEVCIWDASDIPYITANNFS